MKIRLLILTAWMALLAVSCGTKSTSFIKPPFDNVNKALSNFSIDATKDTVIRLETGTQIHIPANSFTDANGNAIKGNIELKYREMHNASEILCSGIPMVFETEGVEQQFESAGMFEINALQNGNELKISNGKQLSVDFASYSKDDGYEHFFLAQPDNQTAMNVSLPFVSTAYAADENSKVQWKSIGKSEIMENEHKKETAKRYNNLFFKLNFDTLKYPANKFLSSIWWETADVNEPSNPNLPANKWVLAEKWESARLFNAMVKIKPFLEDEIVQFPSHGFCEIESNADNTFTVYFTTNNEYSIEEFAPGFREEFMLIAVCDTQGNVLSMQKAGNVFNYLTKETLCFGNFEPLYKEFLKRIKSKANRKSQWIEKYGDMFLPDAKMSVSKMHSSYTRTISKGDKYVEIPDGVEAIAVSADGKYLIIGSFVLKSGLHIYKFNDDKNAYYLDLVNARKKYQTRVLYKGDLEAVNNIRKLMKDVEYQFIANRMAEEKARLDREADFLRPFAVAQLGIYNVDRIYKIPDNVPFVANFDFGDISTDYGSIKVYQITGSEQTVVIRYYSTENVPFAFSPSQPNQLVAILPDNKIARFTDKDFKKLNINEIKSAKKYTFKMKVETQVTSLDMFADIIKQKAN